MKMEDNKLKRAFIDASSGVIAGAVSKTATSPLDVIKIRFQVQLEPTSKWALVPRTYYRRPSKYTGLTQAAREIFREEGLRGFWQGNVPGLLMYMSYGAIQFTCNHAVKTLIADSSKSEDHLRLGNYVSYIIGGVAGTAATLGSYPFDLARTVLASQGEPKVYTNMSSALLNILKQRGICGLYSGMQPTIIEIIPYAGLQFGLYDTFKRWMMTWSMNRSSGSEEISIPQKTVCGFFAGAIAKAICHPLDVVKKRFQVEGLPRDLKYGARVERNTYKNMFEALYQIQKLEGKAGLYKGIYPSMIKSAPAAAVTFAAYELSSRHIKAMVA